MNEPAKTQALAPRGGSGAMFDRIAGRYDLLNRVMSFGIDKRWRKKTVRALNLGPNARVLDLATGTGDLALDILRYHPDSSIVGVDPSRGMLSIGKAKADKRGHQGQFEAVVGVGEALPLPDGMFDGACIAFGIRNCTDRLAALGEMRRVIRPGGRVAVLELSEPRKGVLSPFARFHVRHVIPRLGALLSGSREYRYLQESIAAFPPPEDFAELMRRAGLEVVEVVPLTFGSCHLFVGQRGLAS